MWVWVFIFLLYHGRDFCALTSLQRERMGLGQLLHQASGDGLVGGGPDAAGMAQCGSQLPATTAEPPAPVLLSPKRPPGGQQDQSISSDTELFYSSLSTQDWRLIPPLSLLLPHKIQRGCGFPPASTGEDLPNARINPALLSTLWASPQLNHHFHTIKPKNSKHTIKKPFYNPMYTHTVDTSLTPFALFFFFCFFDFKNPPVQRDTSLANIFFPYQL